MDLSKSRDFFSPVNDAIHIIGCGSVGSTLAEMLVRLGQKKFVLYDFDMVEAKNIANQMFFAEHIHMNKCDAVADILKRINPDVDVRSFKNGWVGQPLGGYLFLCVDNIETRRKILEKNLHNPYMKAVFDFRTRLTDAQHYAADWGDEGMKKNLLNTMDFTHDEAVEETPTSACGVTLGVAPTVRTICSAGVSNFVNFAKGDGIKKVILIDAFGFVMNAF